MNELDQLYQQIIIEHSKSRNGYSEIPSNYLVSHQVNPSCGDELQMGCAIKNGVITDLPWQGQGCSISQASISIMHDLVLNKTVEDAEKLYNDFMLLMHSKGASVEDSVLENLGDGQALQGVCLYPARIKCALLGWMALHDLLLKVSDER